MAARSRVAAGIVLALALLTGCGSQTDQPVVTPGQLTGTWSSSAGGTLVFGADHHFTAAGLRLGYYRGGSGTCSRDTFSGTWQFLTAQWEAAAPGVRQGNVIELNPTSSNEPATTDPSCTGPPTFIPWMGGWFWDKSLQLCQAADPDSGCDGYAFTRRT